MSFYKQWTHLKKEQICWSWQIYIAELDLMKVIVSRLTATAFIEYSLVDSFIPLFNTLFHLEHWCNTLVRVKIGHRIQLWNKGNSMLSILCKHFVSSFKWECFTLAGCVEAHMVKDGVKSASIKNGQTRRPISADKYLCFTLHELISSITTPPWMGC